MQANRTIARKSKQLRRNKGLTRYQLAYKSGLSMSTIRRVEASEETGYNPHLSTLNALANGFRVSLGDFLSSPARVR